MKRSADKIDLLRSLAGDGATASEIAHAMHLSIPTVQRWADDEALADPAVRAKMSAASKKAWADPAVRARIKASRHGAKGVLIPEWVPLDLHDEYLDVAAEQDEFAAARHIRALKRELERHVA